MKENRLRLNVGKELQKLSKISKKQLWMNVSDRILSSRKNRASVNVADISRNTRDGSKIIVPGKVLGSGSINHKVTVAALSFSQGAKAKIVASGGKCLEIAEFAKSTREVKDVIILG
ncbi:MAG: 50S ribosomal protein L18e [Nitrososphaerota archaeon]|nr:50S ribosomal protein L18e [Nitrososphaerota archaeon]